MIQIGIVSVELEHVVDLGDQVIDFSLGVVLNVRQVVSHLDDSIKGSLQVIRVLLFVRDFVVGGKDPELPLHLLILGRGHHHLPLDRGQNNKDGNKFNHDY